jgi:hypothetical protein
VFTALRKHIRQACLLGCVSGAALLIPVVGQASAATYPNGGGSTFTGSAEGWKAVNPECKLLNLLELPLVCTQSGAYDATVGQPPGSFATKTEIPLNLIGIFEGKETLESPSFTAQGSGGGTLLLARAFDPGGLISLNPQLEYTVFLVDKTTNTKQKAVAETVEVEAPFAVKSGTVTLTAGHTYVIQIETATSSTLAGIGLLGGEAIAHFDNVSVAGPNAPEPPNNNNGSNGDNGGNGNNGGNGDNGSGSNGSNGANGVTSAQLQSLMSSSMSGSATLKGNRISVKAGCPAKVGVACNISLQGMLSRKKVATAGRRAKVKPGKAKNFVLTVKPAARATVKTKKKLLFKEKVKAGSATATVWKTLPLKHG